jgi:hypothetical protein
MKFRLIPREEKFFTDFQALADELKHGARLLEEMLAPERPAWDKADEIKEAEHKCDQLTHEIIQRLNRTFVTPLDREDIFNLARSLDDVMDAIDAVSLDEADASIPLLTAGLQQVASPRSLWAKLLLALQKRLAPPRALASLMGFRDLLVSLTSDVSGVDVSTAIGLMLDRSGYLRDLREVIADDLNRARVIGQETGEDRRMAGHDFDTFRQQNSELLEKCHQFLFRWRLFYTPLVGGLTPAVASTASTCIPLVPFGPGVSTVAVAVAVASVGFIA